MPDQLILHAPPIGDIKVSVRFHAFPNACYLCKNTGHFARECPQGQEKEGLAPKAKQGEPGGGSEGLPQGIKEGETKAVAGTNTAVNNQELLAEQGGFTKVTYRRNRGRGHAKPLTTERLQTLKTFFNAGSIPSFSNASP